VACEWRTLYCGDGTASPGGGTTTLGDGTVIIGGGTVVSLSGDTPDTGGGSSGQFRLNLTTGRNWTISKTEIILKSSLQCH